MAEVNLSVHLYVRVEEASITPIWLDCRTTSTPEELGEAKGTRFIKYQSRRNPNN